MKTGQARKMSGRPDEVFRVRFMVDGETTVDNGTISGWRSAPDREEAPPLTDKQIKFENLRWKISRICQDLPISSTPQMPSTKYHLSITCLTDDHWVVSKFIFNFLTCQSSYGKDEIDEIFLA